MGRTVILEHTSTSGESHFDWLIAPDAVPPPDGRDLVHFRAAERPDSLALRAVLPAVRGPAHSRRYLTYEGELDGGRGAVRRIGEGTAELEESAEGRITVNARFAERAVVIEARPEGGPGDRWILRRTR